MPGDAEAGLGISAANGVNIVYRQQGPDDVLLPLLLMVGLSFLLLRIMSRRTGTGGGMNPFGNIFDGFRRANFKLVDKQTPHALSPKIRLKDVAGLHEAKVRAEILAWTGKMSLRLSRDSSFCIFCFGPLFGVFHVGSSPSTDDRNRPPRYRVLSCSCNVK